MRAWISLGLSLCLLVPAAGAQNAKGADDPQAAARSEGLKPAAATAKVQSAATPSAASGSSSWQYWTNLIIPPGAAVSLDSSFDYSSARTVRVSLRSQNNDLSQIELVAYWATPGLPLYNTVEHAFGGDFQFENVGGTTFQTYGTQFRLRLINSGPAQVTLMQVLIFTPGA